MSKGQRLRAERAAEAAGGKDLSAYKKPQTTPSHLQKLDRASQHIKELNAAQEAWLGTGAYSFFSERDPQTGKTIVRAKITEPPPGQFSLIVGDAVHAMRSALDHLALELAVAHQRPGSLPEAMEKASEFPIFPLEIGNDQGRDIFHRVKKKTGEPAPSSGLYKLQGAHPDAVKAIEGIQPYNRGSAFAEDPLWVIHELDRIDKHRRLHLTAYAVENIGVGAGPNGSAYFGEVLFEQMGHIGPVEDGTPVAIFTASPDSHFQLDFARQIALAESSLPEGGLLEVLTKLRDYVRDEVMAPLNGFL
ncbi:MAG: hypothetical protein ACTHLH_10915 [Solirubrobacterales bacterium]